MAELRGQGPTSKVRAPPLVHGLKEASRAKVTFGRAADFGHNVEMLKRAPFKLKSLGRNHNEAKNKDKSHRL